MGRFSELLRIQHIFIKIDRYVDLFNTGTIGKPFPHILILSEQRYALDDQYPYKIFQAYSFSNFVNALKRHPVTTVQESGIKIKIG